MQTLGDFFAMGGYGFFAYLSLSSELAADRANHARAGGHLPD